MFFNIWSIFLYITHAYIFVEQKLRISLISEKEIPKHALLQKHQNVQTSLECLILIIIKILINPRDDFRLMVNNCQPKKCIESDFTRWKFIMTHKM